jgi:hypothetical protein
LLPEEQRQNTVRSQSQKVGRPALIQTRDSFGNDCFPETVDDSAIHDAFASRVHRLIVHSCADHVQRRHEKYGKQTATSGGCQIVLPRVQLCDLTTNKMQKIQSKREKERERVMRTTHLIVVQPMFSLRERAKLNSRSDRDS